MPKYVALLRGINVGSHQRLAMADLRGLLTGLGYADVKTHLQSGNALLTTGSTGSDKIAGAIEKAIARDLRLQVKALVRSGAELAEVVAGNPLDGVVTDGARYLVAFLSAAPGRDRLGAVDPDTFAPEQFRAGRRELYLWYPNGVHQSKMSNSFWEKQLGVTATSRNWNTVTRLLELTG